MARLPNFLVIIRSEKLSGKGQGRGGRGAKKRTFRFGKKNVSFPKVETFRFADYILKKEVIHDDYDVVLLKAFFAVNDMYLPLSPTAVLKLVADDKLQFQIRDRVEGFSEWKENELKKLSA